MVFPVGNDKVGTCPEIRYNDVYVVSTNLLKMMNPSVRLTEIKFQKRKNRVSFEADTNKKGCQSDSLESKI